MKVSPPLPAHKHALLPLLCYTVICPQWVCCVVGCALLAASPAAWSSLSPLKFLMATFGGCPPTRYIALPAHLP